MKRYTETYFALYTHICDEMGNNDLPMNVLRNIV